MKDWSNPIANTGKFIRFLIEFLNWMTRKVTETQLLLLVYQKQCLISNGWILCEKKYYLLAKVSSSDHDIIKCF